MKLSADEFADLVDQALRDIPEAFLEYMADVVIDIEPMPDAATCKSLGIRDPRELLGLYRGTPLTERSVEEFGRLPDHIAIYQENIERRCRTHHQVIRQIRTTVFHEVGHYFGLDEDELEALGFR